MNALKYLLLIICLLFWVADALAQVETRPRYDVDILGLVLDPRLGLGIWNHAGTYRLPDGSENKINPAVRIIYHTTKH